MNPKTIRKELMKSRRHQVPKYGPPPLIESYKVIILKDFVQTRNLYQEQHFNPKNTIANCEAWGGSIILLLKGMVHFRIYDIIRKKKKKLSQKCNV